MVDHHPTLSPSTLPAVAQCRHYQGVGGDSEAADSGTLQHQALEQILRGEEPKMLACLDPTEQSQVEWAAAKIREIMPRAIAVEMWVNVFTPHGFNPLTFGWTDAASEHAVADYKSGEMRDYSAQMAAYALGWMQANGLDWCEAYIVYGRYRQVERMEFTRQQAEEIVYRLARERFDQAIPPNPCDYCGWCAAATTCPALVAVVDRVATAVAEPEVSIVWPGADTPPEVLAEMKGVAAIVSRWCGAVDDAVRDALLAGGAVPGYEITERAGAREVKDLAGAFSALGLPQDQFLACCKLAIGQAEAAFAAVQGLKAAAAKREVAQRLEPFIERRPPSKIVSKIKLKELGQ